MRSVREQTWERTLSRYFAAAGIPLTWDGLAKRFTGIRLHSFARVNPLKPGSLDNRWNLMPQNLKKVEASGDRGVIIVTNRRYGDDVEDSIVVMRLGTFMPMLKAFIDNDKERWTSE